jgi:hypothetical protein
MFSSSLPDSTAATGLTDWFDRHELASLRCGGQPSLRHGVMFVLIAQRQQKVNVA